MKGSYLCKSLLVGLLCLAACSPSTERGIGEAGSDVLIEKLAEARTLAESAPLQSSELALDVLAQVELKGNIDLAAAAKLILCTYTTPPLAIDTTLAFCREAMGYYEQYPGRKEQGIVLNSIGILHDIKGEKDLAVQSFEEA